VALKSDAAAEKSKDQLSRDFPGRSISDFCNNICQNRTWGILARSQLAGMRGEETDADGQEPLSRKRALVQENLLAG
jgi:hypothetical protein